MPDATFALVGPEQTAVSKLRERPNIHLLGMRQHADLPRYVKAFDVGIVPYRLTPYTANVYPTKLNEYLSMGIPVVATDLPEIRRFNTQHGDLVRVAGDSATFANEVRAALRVAPADEVDRRVAVAQENSWASRVTAMTGLIDEAMERRAATRQRWDETLRRVYRRTRWRVAQTVFAVAAVYLLVFNTNALWWVARPLQMTAPAEKADAIVVFAGGVGESGKAGGGAQERIKHAVDLYRGGYAPMLILSSGYVYTFHEAEVMRALAIDQGVPPSRILLEEQATNTYQNVSYVDRMLREHRWQKIVLVSSPYHMLRAILVWRKQAPHVDVVPSPVPESEFYAHVRGASAEQVRGILQEYLAIAAYWKRGWL
jgi:uncharacterized SAM-binding protein YcdF (DUF218 family)